MKGRLIIFVKAPRLGAVKTRLARDIGRAAAWRFYRAEMASLLRRLGPMPGYRLELWVTPDEFALRGRFWPSRYLRFPQGQGDLGRRMARALDAGPSCPAILIGSDIPGISLAHIATAFAALRRRDAVFGPAKDGGFWLVGLPARRRAGVIFDNVRWSSPHALRDSLANFPKSARVAMATCLRDVDTGEDFTALVSGF